MPWETWRIIIIYTGASTLALLLCDWWVNRSRFGIKKGGWEDKYNIWKEQRRRKRLPLEEQEAIIKKELALRRKLEARLERERLRDEREAREYLEEREREDKRRAIALIVSDAIAAEQVKAAKEAKERIEQENLAKALEKENLEKTSEEEKEPLKQENLAKAKEDEPLSKPKE
jgi:hypothetical protein